MIELRRCPTITSVVARWAAQYKDAPTDSKQGLVTTALQALPRTASAADVEAIIGNDSWTRRWCAGCNEYVFTAVQFHEEDSAVCKNCLKKALALIEETDHSHCKTCTCVVTPS